MSGPSMSAGLGLMRSQFSFHPPIPTSDFSGQTVIVTGGNAGLGREAGKHIARLNAERLIIACRTVAKGEEARSYIQQQTPGSKTAIEVWQLDLSNYASVKAFAQKAQGLQRLDAVLENAGIWPTKFELVEGHEATITVNVISTFLLAYLLLPKLHETAANFPSHPRLTIVSSALHGFATLSSRKSPAIFTALAQPLANTKDFDARYNDTKLLEVLFVQRLAAAMTSSSEKAKASNDKSGPNPAEVCLAAVHPGYCISALRPPTTAGQRMAEKVLARTTDEGARVLVDSIAADKVVGRHGAYISDFKVEKPAAWIKTKDGEQTKERVWTELNEILERIAPGCTTIL